ncbi:MAG: hypothetical protein ACUVRL_07265 [Candidatus Saccharicenans sp.]|uniref:hypothetical protein n=1 Tax=Candidatus Saccharicenans sp. TaxID=2819258 RepID=UPI00404A2EA7
MTVMLALTGFAVWLYLRFQNIFFVNIINFKLVEAQPIFQPEPGRRISLIIIAMFAAATISLFIKLFTRSRWVDVVSKCVSLVLIGLLLRQPFDNLFAINIPDWWLPKIKTSLIALLLFIAAMTAVELIKILVILSRKKLAK